MTGFTFSHSTAYESCPRKSETFYFTRKLYSVLLSWLCAQSSSINKCGMHLADVCAIFKSDFDIICAIGFPTPDLSAM